ncbi:MAG: DUF748 domain-containing protein [Cyclobacteriaceae bacterium]|nr:DUF748 domain-containing protein [Cyclobacteriaceae bacterium]
MLKWVRKILLALLILVASFVVIIVVFAGRIAEWTLERYDEEWTGRRIEVDKIRVNLFTGTVRIDGLTAFEYARPDTFFHIASAFANLELTHFLGGDYDVTEITVTKPRILVDQDGNSFNFDDLIERFGASDDTTAVSPAAGEPVRYRLENLRIDSATIHYREKSVGAEVVFNPLTARCPLIAWNDPNHHYELEAGLAPTTSGQASGGTIGLVFDLNLDSLEYRLASNLSDVQISPFAPYARDVIDISLLEGLLSMQFNLAGNFNSPSEVALSGKQQLRTFRLTDPEQDTLFSLSSFSIAVDSLNTSSAIYDFGAFELDGPYLAFELYPDGDNFTRLLRDTTTTTSSDSVASEIDYSNPFRLLVSYANDIIEEYVMQNYSVDSVVVTNGTVVYKDYTLEDPFYFRLDSLHLSSGALNSQNSDLNFIARSRVNNTGILDAALSFDPHNLENVEMVYGIRDVRISSFTPYSNYYVAHPFQDGLIYYNSETKVLNRIIDSKNKLEIRRIDVGKKIGRKPVYNLPLRLAVAILRDVNGNINMEIPVSGDLNDPEYKLGKVIWGIIENLLVKAATSPYRLLAQAINADENDLKAISFDYLSDSLTNRQRRNLSMLGRVLKVKPELRINLHYLPGNTDELSLLAAFEAKKRYILKIDTLREEEPNAAQLKEIEALSINDSAFVSYLNRRLLFEGSLSPIEKCMRYVGRRRLQNRMAAIIDNRKRLITDYLITEQQLPAEAFAFVDEPDRTSDGLPMFEVTFDVYEP